MIKASIKANYITLIFLLMSSFVRAQEVDVQLQKFVDIELMSQEESIVLSDQFSKKQPKSNLELLYILFQFEYKKANGFYYSSLTISSIASVDDNSTEKRNTTEQEELNKLLFDYVSKLKGLALVNEKQFRSQSDEIKNNAFFSLHHFLLETVNRVHYDEWMGIDNLQAYRANFYATGIINKDENDRLFEAISYDKISSAYQLIDYCEKARLIDLSVYSNDPKEYIEKIHELTSEVLPVLKCSNFKFEIKVDSLESYDDHIYYKLLVSLDANGKTYRQKSSFYPEKVKEAKEFYWKIDAQSYYKIYNKVLKDLGSPYRLHRIKAYVDSKTVKANQFFGIAALKEDQTENLSGTRSYWELSHESFDTLTTEKIADAISAYKEMGLFDHLNQQQMSKSIEQISEMNMWNLNDVLTLFPELIFSADYELSNLENPYQEILTEYARVSHYKFAPIHIKDGFDMKLDSMTIAFDWDGKHYSERLKVSGDWVDSRFFEYVNELMAKNDIEGRFYSLYGDGETIVYLSPEQYNYIRKNKLLVFLDEWKKALENQNY